MFGLPIVLENVLNLCLYVSRIDTALKGVCHSFSSVWYFLNCDRYYIPFLEVNILNTRFLKSRYKRNLNHNDYRLELFSFTGIET